MEFVRRSIAENERVLEHHAAVAHDFRNLLQIAVSAVSVTRHRLMQRSEAELTVALDHALLALDRVNRFAEYVSSSSVPFRSTSVRLQLFLHGLEPLLRQALGDRIRCELLVDQDLPDVCCPPHEFENALLNLLMNARDAMRAGGSLKIEARICVCCRGEMNCTVLSVTDTGHGMPPEIAARAFDLHFTTKQAQGGSGIGLHNVRLFAERLGGFVELQSSPRAGTSVRLHLPAGHSAASVERRTCTAD